MFEHTNGNLKEHTLYFETQAGPETMSAVERPINRRLAPPVSADDHTLGPADASITLVEYGDYACPFCTETYPKVEKLRRDLGETLRFAYRHVPVISPARSRRAAEAAEAAAAQERFWEMHDLLSTEPGAHLTEERLLELAQSLDLDMEVFESALRDNRHAPQIEQHLESVRQSQVDSAPTFFVNGAPFDDSLHADSLLGFAEERSEQLKTVAQR